MKHAKKMVCSVAAVVTLIVSGVVPSEVRVSQAGLELIGNAEGCRLEPYTCPAGLLTNGIGNTHGVTGDEISLEQAAADWARNIEDAQACLTQATTQGQLTQGQYDAFTSFIFNTGCPRFKHNRDGSETQIYKHIKSGDYESACYQLNRWVYGGGVKLKGLVVRRQKETELCLH